MSAPADLKKRAREIFTLLRREYPDAHCELIGWKTPFDLAVAAILSAQCTDKRVNMVTPALFAAYPTVADWAAAPQEQLEEQVRSTGFFRNKARNIRALAAVLVEKYAGQLPDDFDALITLPGIGRKTANLLEGTAFGNPGLVVDTHMIRLSGRLGLTQNTDPEKIEYDLKALLPARDWIGFSHGMVFHGRRCCFARKPECARCVLSGVCPRRGLG
jgi:endonuclease-3